MQLSANDRQRSKGYIAALVQLLTECEKQEASIKKKKNLRAVEGHQMCACMQ